MERDDGETERKRNDEMTGDKGKEVNQMKKKAEEMSLGHW
jgi:hypothetical protein